MVFVLLCEHLQAAELQKLSETLEQQLKVANDQIAHSESTHASSVAQHIKRLEDKEVRPCQQGHPLRVCHYLAAETCCVVQQCCQGLLHHAAKVARLTQWTHTDQNRVKLSNLLLQDHASVCHVAVSL